MLHVEIFGLRSAASASVPVLSILLLTNKAFMKIWKTRPHISACVVAVACQHLMTSVCFYGHYSCILIAAPTISS